MHEQENIFIKTAMPPRDVAELLAGWFDLEQIPDGEDTDTDIGLRGRARTADGHLGFRIRPNQHAEPHPAPDESQAIDAYELQVGVWYGHGKTAPEIQQREAWVVLDRLVYERPQVAMLLCHGVDILVAAYLPGAGVHPFPPKTTIDAADMGLWRPWLASPQSWENDLLSEVDPAIVRRACEVLSNWVGTNTPGLIGPFTLSQDFARWNICPYDEWLLFTPPRGYSSKAHLADERSQFPSPGEHGSEAYLVCGSTVYFFWATEQALDDALQSARALRESQGPQWRRWLSGRRSR